MARWNLEEFRKTRHYPWFVLGLLGVGSFMVNLDTSIVNVALPYIAEEYNADITVVQWIVTSYLLTVVGSVTIIGRLGDLFGRSRVYSVGFIVFIVGSLFCAFAPNAEWMIAFRVLQALGGACVPANNMGILVRTFPPERKGQALGSLASIVAIGALAGPSVGGFLISAYGWPSIFLINVPIGILASILFYIMLPHKKIAETRPAFDYLGSLLFILSAVGGMWALSNASESGFSSGVILLTLGISLALFTLFYFYEKRVAFPVLDFGIFKAAAFRMGAIAMMSSQMMLYMVNLLMPFYLTQILRLQPSLVGLTMTPVPIAMALMAPFSGWLSDRIGYNIPAISGLLTVSGAMLLLSLLPADASTFDVGWRLALLAAGHSLFNSPNNSAMMSCVPRKNFGIAGSTIATVRKTAQVLGVAFGVFLFDSRMNAILAQWPSPTPAQYEEAFMAGLSFAFRVGMVIPLLAVAAAYVRKKDMQKMAGEEVDVPGKKDLAR